MSTPKWSTKNARFHWELLHRIKRASGRSWDELASHVGRDPASGLPWVSGDRLRRAGRRGGELPHYVIVPLAHSLQRRPAEFYTYKEEPPLRGVAAGFTLFTYLERRDPELADAVFASIAVSYPELVRVAVPAWEPPQGVAA